MKLLSRLLWYLLVLQLGKIELLDKWTVPEVFINPPVVGGATGPVDW